MNYETKIIIDDDGEKSTEKTITILIKDKSENWLSHVELMHNPSLDLSVNYAYILDLNGNRIRKLKKKELNTRNNLSYQAFYQDDLITEFDLYWNQYPYIVKYSYTVEENEYLYVAWWTPLFFKNVTTIRSSLTVDLPSNFDYKVQNSYKIPFTDSVQDNRRRLDWVFNTANEIRSEIYSPEANEIQPLIKLIPNKFTYGIEGNTNSWSSFGLWMEELNKGMDKLTPQEELNVKKLISNCSSKAEIVRTIYHYLQDHTRYVNVDIDIGGLKSYPASYVCKNKYGDCKALTTYMKAMLKSVGIKSFYSIISAGETNSEVNKNLPSQQFNHVILMVPLAKDTVWLENTSNSSPFNYLGSFTQNRYTLVVDGEQSQLVKTPKLLLNDVLEQRNYHFRVEKSGNTHIDVNLILKGNKFENFRYYIFKKNKKQQYDAINRYHRIKKFRTENWHIIDFRRDSTFLHLNLDGTSSSSVRQIGIFSVITPLRIKLPNFEKPQERTLDVKIDLPINKFDKSIYDLKAFSEKQIQVSEGMNIKSKYGQYQASFTIKNNKVIIQEKFVLFSNRIPIEKYEDLYNFINSINKYKKTAAILIK